MLHEPYRCVSAIFYAGQRLKHFYRSMRLIASSSGAFSNGKRGVPQYGSHKKPAMRPRKRPAGSTLPSLAIFACLVSELSAQYRFDSWTTENGLPQNSIWGIRQTRWLFVDDHLVGPGAL